MLAATVPAGRLNPPTAGRCELFRPRLHDALTAAVATAPLTVITGTAGSGKTVLAAAWARAAGPQHVAWLSLGPMATGSASAFWGAVLAALDRAGVPLGALAAPVRGRRLPPGFTVRLATHLAALPRPTVLVIDHADALTRPDILETLDLVAGSARFRLRLVLLARADPLLPLARERAAGRLAEIRTDDLAFRPAEVEAFLAGLGTPVPGPDAAALAAATGGWAVTLPLVGALLRRRVPSRRLAGAIAGDDAGPAQYLVAQVLARLPDSVRAVLLRAGLAGELWPGLVASLTGVHGSRILRSLAAGYACVEPADGAPGGLRIPQLVRELLTAELAFTDPEGYATAHRAAAGWYAAAARLPEAVTHAVAAGDWSSTATLLVDDLAVAALLARSGPPEADLLDAARPELHGADAALLRAAARLGRTGTVSPTDLTLAADASTGAGADRPARRASAALLLAAAAVSAGTDPDRALAAINTAQIQAAVLVTPRPERRAECAAVLATMRASTLLATDAGDAVLTEVGAAAEAACAAADTDRLRAGRLADLALLQALAGRLRQAEALVDEYQALSESHGIPRAIRSPAAATAAAWICAEREQAGEARRWTARAAEGSGHRRATYTAPLLAVLESRRLRLSGQLDHAGHALTAASTGDPPPRWVREQVLGERVRLALARKDAGALDLLDALPAASPRAAALRTAAAALGMTPALRAVPEAPDTGVLPVVALEALLARAGLLAAGGNTAGAVAVLDEALRAAEPHQLRRPFRDAPPAAQRLLRTHPGLAAARGWLFTTQQPGPWRPPTPRQPGSPAQLSDREREALTLLAAGLSTAGIAAAMGTSTNTTRGHLRSILRKLSAADRTDALRWVGPRRESS